VYENNVLRGILGPKRGEVTGGWEICIRKIFHNFYSLPNIIRMIRSRRLGWAGNIARMTCAYKVLVGRTSHRGETNIKMDLK
jgi:hypothetical protein